MTTHVIDFCIEEDGFIDLSSPDYSADQLEAQRESLERWLSEEGVPRGSFGELYIQPDGFICEHRPCSDD